MAKRFSYFKLKVSNNTAFYNEGELLEAKSRDGVVGAKINKSNWLEVDTSGDHDAPGCILLQELHNDDLQEFVEFEKINFEKLQKEK